VTQRCWRQETGCKDGPALFLVSVCAPKRNSLPERIAASLVGLIDCLELVCCIAVCGVLQLAVDILVRCLESMLAAYLLVWVASQDLNGGIGCW
jgi:hypothetical protein